jgi:hypothetical protein
MTGHDLEAVDEPWNGMFGPSLTFKSDGKNVREWL